MGKFKVGKVYKVSTSSLVDEGLEARVIRKLPKGFEEGEWVRYEIAYVDNTENKNAIPMIDYCSESGLTYGFMGGRLLTRDEASIREEAIALCAHIAYLAIDKDPKTAAKASAIQKSIQKLI